MASALMRTDAYTGSGDATGFLCAQKAAAGESRGQSARKRGLGAAARPAEGPKASRGAGRGVTPAPKMQPDGDGFAMFREMGYNKIRKQSEKFRQKKQRNTKKRGRRDGMKKITALLLTALTAAVLLCGCAGGTAVQLSYAESFVLSAFNDINGTSFGAQAGGCTLSTATYAYTDGETLARCAPKTATQRELGFYNDIYCCVRLWVIRDGETVMYERFFALSGYDLTQELSREELRAALDGLTAHLEFERCDLSRLSRFLPIAPLA